MYQHWLPINSLNKMPSHRLCGRVVTCWRLSLHSVQQKTLDKAKLGRTADLEFCAFVCSFVFFFLGGGGRVFAASLDYFCPSFGSERRVGDCRSV